MTVMPIVNNVVATISSVPAPAQPGQPVTFTASVVNGGQSPAYRWQRNGVDVGVNTQNWSTNNLAPYDKITCIITSSDPCANPKIDTSAPIEVNFPTSVGKAKGSLATVVIYPNPANDILNIDGITKGTKIQIIDITGRVLLKWVADNNAVMLNINSLTAGNYIISITDPSGNRIIDKFTKQ